MWFLRYFVEVNRLFPIKHLLSEITSDRLRSDGGTLSSRKAAAAPPRPLELGPRGHGLRSRGCCWGRQVNDIFAGGGRGLVGLENLVARGVERIVESSPWVMHQIV